MCECCHGPQCKRQQHRLRDFSAEQVGGPDTTMVLAAAEVFGQDLRAAHRAGGCLDDRGVPVRELEALAGIQGGRHHPAREVLDGEAPEQLDEPDRLLVTDGIRADHAGRSCAAGPGWSELV